MKQKRKLKDSILRKTKRKYLKNEKNVFKIPPDAEILVCDFCKEYKVYPTHYDIKMMVILYVKDINWDPCVVLIIIILQIIYIYIVVFAIVVVK